MKLIKEYVEEKKQELREEFSKLQYKPSLAIVQVGNNKASEIYVKNKLKDAKELGINTYLYKYDENITEQYLLDVVKVLNNDRTISGYIVQLPLPKHINEETIKLAINPEKDIDGFHPMAKTIAATPLGIYNYLKDMGYEFKGKNAVIIGRSNIVGKPMHKLLVKSDMNAIMLHTKTTEEDKKFYLKHADLIIVAAGHLNTLTSEYKLKKNAIIFDVGINREAGLLCGDCETNLPVAFQSPVPGGVGLLTRLAIFENLLFILKTY